jgi:hypothetical protein
MRDGDSVGGKAMRTLHVADLGSNDVVKQESKDEILPSTGTPLRPNRNTSD